MPGDTGGRVFFFFGGWGVGWLIGLFDRADNRVKQKTKRVIEAHECPVGWRLSSRWGNIDNSLFPCSARDTLLVEGGSLQCFPLYLLCYPQTPFLEVVSMPQLQLSSLNPPCIPKSQLPLCAICPSIAAESQGAGSCQAPHSPTHQPQDPDNNERRELRVAAGLLCVLILPLSLSNRD